MQASPLIGRAGLALLHGHRTAGGEQVSASQGDKCQQASLGSAVGLLLLGVLGMDWHGRVKLAASSSDSLRGEPLLVMMALSTYLATDIVYLNSTTMKDITKILR